MAEAMVLVCDVCGKPAVDTVTISVGRARWQKDLCQAHLAELTSGTRRPRPGRRRGAVVVAPSPRRRGRPPGSKNKSVSGNGRRRSRSVPKNAPVPST